MIQITGKSPSPPVDMTSGVVVPKDSSARISTPGSGRSVQLAWRGSF